MATIFMGNIMKSVREYAESKEGQRVMAEKISEYKKKGVDQTGGGSMILTLRKMEQIADSFIDMLQMNAYTSRMPQSVYEHFDSLKRGNLDNIGSYVVMDRSGGGISSYSDSFSSPFGADGYRSTDIDYYMVDIYFEDARTHRTFRPSLRYKSSIFSSSSGRTGAGIDNIVLLFNNGYARTRKPVSGIWDGHEELGVVWGKRERVGLHFIEATIAEFNRIYGRYGVTAMYN